jgi:hypothetical protein
MLQYTQTSLHTALTLWNVNSDPDFANTLPEIVRKGEIRCARALDLDLLDSATTAVTAAGVTTVTKPATLIYERTVTINVGGVDKVLVKRGRAWVKLMNASGTQGTPEYYCENDLTTWALAPIPLGIYTVTVQGNYLLNSIEDGPGSTVTWFSTQVPDLLYWACSIEACEFLKAWAKKAQNEADFEMAQRRFGKLAQNLQRVDTLNLPGGNEQE